MLNVMTIYTMKIEQENEFLAPARMTWSDGKARFLFPSFRKDSKFYFRSKNTEVFKKANSL